MTFMCPECELRPADPLSESVERCDAHRLELTGSADHLVEGPTWTPFSSAEEGTTTRAMCALIHRDHAEPE